MLALYRPLPPPFFYLVKLKLLALPPPPKSQQKLHSERSFSCHGTPKLVCCLSLKKQHNHPPTPSHILKFSRFLCKVMQFARLPLWSTSKRTRVPVEIWTLLSQHFCQCLFTNEIGQCCAELFRSININNSSSFSTSIANSISHRNFMQHHQEWKDFKVFVKNKVIYWHFQFLSLQEPKNNPNGGRVANCTSTPKKGVWKCKIYWLLLKGVPNVSI